MPGSSLVFQTRGLAVLSFTVLQALGGSVRPLSGQEEAFEALRELAETAGVSFTWTGDPQEVEYDWGRRSWRSAAEWEIQAYAPILIEELGLYPMDLLRRSKVKEIILCRDLWVEMEGVNQHVSGHLDYGTGTLWVSVAFTYKVNNRAKQRRALHHAFFHQLDYVMGTFTEDPAWKALNPDGFQYGAYGLGGIHDRTSAGGLLTNEYPGFLNRYSTGHIADDKADIFAYLMVVHHYVEDRGEDDPVIQAKIEEIKRRLEAFDPGLNAEFWKTVDGIMRDVTPYITP